MFILFTSLILFFFLWTVFLLQLQWTILQVIQLQLQYWASAMKFRWCHDLVAFWRWSYSQAVSLLLILSAAGYLPAAGPPRCWFYKLLVLRVAGSISCWFYQMGCFRFFGGFWFYQLLIIPVSHSTSIRFYELLVMPVQGFTCCWW